MPGIDSDLNIKSRSGLPGLLFWQKLVPAFAFGILSIKWFIPALICFAVYLFLLLCFRLERGAVVLLVLLFGAGNWYGNYSLPGPPGSMPDWMVQREKVEINGAVKSVRADPGGRLKILLQDVWCNSTRGITALEGNLNWTWDLPEQRPLPGQKVRLTARVKPSIGFRNSGLWDYTFYNRTKNIFYRTYTRGPLKGGELKPYEPDFLQRLRISLRKHILQNAPPAQAGAVFPALLTGDRFFLSKETVELIRKAGVSHILALSGLHVGFVVSIGFILSWVSGLVAPGIYLRISRMKLGVLFAIPFVLVYLWLGQFTPSLLRAACMFGFWGLLLFMDRGRIILDGLFMAVLLILCVEPLSIFHLGFQLSVLAVGGIGLLFPFFQKLLPSGRGPFSMVSRFILGVFYVSLCANIAILPVLIWNFGTVLPNLLFNILFVPLLGIFIVPICGIGGLAASYFWPWAAEKLFAAGGLCFLESLNLVRWAEHAGWLPEYAVYRPLWEGILVYYLFLGLLLLFLNRDFSRAKFVLLPMAILFFVRLYPFSTEPEVRMDLLDTGQSQCVIIKGPAGSRTVVDGGGSFGDFDMGRAVVGPWLTHGNLPAVDNIFMTHGDRDHAGGLAFLLEKFEVGRFFSNGDIPSGKIGDRFLKAFAEKGIKTKELERGDRVELEPGLEMLVIHPYRDFAGSRNDRSLYLKLIWNGRALVSIGGDVDRKGVRAVVQSGMNLRSQLLVLPHHGSAGSYSPELYRQVHPDAALAACGLLNRFDFVTKKVRQELQRQGIPLYTTASSGMITVYWDSNFGMRLVP